MARLAGLEPAAYDLGGRRSIRLSYRRLNLADASQRVSRERLRYRLRDRITSCLFPLSRLMQWPVLISGMALQ